jgi:hypothetical protein
VEAFLQGIVYFVQFPKYVYPQEIQELEHLLVVFGEDLRPIVN